MRAYMILALVIAILSAIFAIQNATPVTVYIYGFIVESSLAVVLMVTFTAGVITSLILSAAGNAETLGRIFCTAGPNIIESRTFYDLIASALGVPPSPVNEISVQAHLAENPAGAPFCCHRVYSLDRIRAAGLDVPQTPVAEGLRAHVESLLD